MNVEMGGSCLQKSVADELQSFVILAHPTLKVDPILAVMLTTVVGILGHRCKGNSRLADHSNYFASFKSNEVRLKPMDDGWEGVARSHYIYWQD